MESAFFCSLAEPPLQQCRVARGALRRGIAGPGRVSWAPADVSGCTSWVQGADGWPKDELYGVTPPEELEKVKVWKAQNKKKKAEKKKADKKKKKAEEAEKNKAEEATTEQKKAEEAAA